MTKSTPVTVDDATRVEDDQFPAPLVLLSPSSSSDGEFNYFQYMKANRPEVAIEEMLAKKKRKSKLLIKDSLTVSPSVENDEYGTWTTDSRRDNYESDIWRNKKVWRRTQDVIGAFMKLHGTDDKGDFEITNNMVSLKIDARRKSSHPKNFVIWLRGDRVYDLEADRGTLEEFIQDCNMAHVFDFNRPDVRSRRAAQGLPPFPYAPGEIGKAAETSSATVEE